MDSEELKALFVQLRAEVTNPQEVEELERKYFLAASPTNRFSMISAVADAWNLLRLLKDRGKGMPLVERLDLALREELHGRGYRNNILTHQEHLLLGSSGSGKNPNAREFPYTVGSILSGDVTVEEARKARELESPCGALPSYWGIEGEGLGEMMLPPIDDRGVTLHDPVLIRVEGREVHVEKLADNTSYRRG